MPLPTLEAVTTTELLVVPQELGEAALGSLKLDVSSETTDDYKQAALALADAQQALEGYLNRRLLVHPVTEYPGYGWGPYDTARALWGLRLPDWPYVALHADSGVTVADHGFVAGEAYPGGQTVYVETTPDAADALVYYAGWRGRQHTLTGASGSTDLNTVPGLEALATLPPLLPAVLRMVIADYAYVLLDQRRSGTMGGKRKQQALPSGAVVSEGHRASAEEEILARAHAYRLLTP